MAAKNRQKPRIVLYGAGNFGQRVTRFAVENDWSIVAAFNRAGDKVGQDLVSCIKLTVDMRAFDAHAPLLSKSPQHFLSIRTVFYLRYVFR